MVMAVTPTVRGAPTSRGAPPGPEGRKEAPRNSTIKRSLQRVERSGGPRGVVRALRKISGRQQNRFAKQVLDRANKTTALACKIPAKGENPLGVTTTATLGIA